MIRQSNLTKELTVKSPAGIVQIHYNVLSLKMKMVAFKLNNINGRYIEKIDKREREKHD